MKKETCENCKWRKGETRKEIEARPTHTSDGNRIVYDIVKDGYCWRFPEHKEVWLYHFCGEFKKNLNK